MVPKIPQRMVISIAIIKHMIEHASLSGVNVLHEVRWQHIRGSTFSFLYSCALRVAFKSSWPTWGADLRT